MVPLPQALLFSTTWLLSEYARAHLFTGFPWLLLGIAQYDTPLQPLLPLIGIFGTGWVACLVAAGLSYGLLSLQHWRFLSASLLLLFLPSWVIPTTWTQESGTPLSVGVIQANLSMRNKWDPNRFWGLLDHYRTQIYQLLDQDLIVLPESALPIPAHYLQDYLRPLQQAVDQAHSALVVGLPSARALRPPLRYYNTLLKLGSPVESYFKQHLVPFGEYIPRPFQGVARWLHIPDPALLPGPQNQPLFHIKQHPVASVVCYELAYDQLLRAQLPEAELIISASDDGWFGHSLAMYQQQQIAQVRSLQTGRPQVVSNNDGLSALLDSKGRIITSLAAEYRGFKRTYISHHRQHPWVTYGDWPFFVLLSGLLGGWAFFRRYERVEKTAPTPVAAV